MDLFCLFDGPRFPPSISFVLAQAPVSVSVVTRRDRSSAESNLHEHRHGSRLNHNPDISISLHTQPEDPLCLPLHGVVCRLTEKSRTLGYDHPLELEIRLDPVGSDLDLGWRGFSGREAGRGTLIIRVALKVTVRFFFCDLHHALENWAV